MRARAEETLESEREMAAATERENDDLRRHVAWLLSGGGRSRAHRQSQHRKDEPRFDPDFCGDVPEEVAGQLPGVEYPESKLGLRGRARHPRERRMGEAGLASI